MIKIENDELNRTRVLNAIFGIFDNFGNQDGRGLTMVINGKFGSGKSTFLDFIEERNIEESKYNIIRYNAWENNYFENPLIPILYTISKERTIGEKIEKQTINILKNLPKFFMSFLSGKYGGDFDSLFSCKNIFEEYDGYRKAVKEFKGVLGGLCQQKKTILLVDELDRCLPEYQIRMLECLYHIFDVPDLIVVIALDKEQLEISVKNMFGASQNTYGYLAKFIQYEIDLPNREQYEYVERLMTFKCKDSSAVKILIAKMFKSIDMSLRECQNIIKVLNLICNEKDDYGHLLDYVYYYPLIVVVLLLLKQLDNTIYNKYFGDKKHLMYFSFDVVHDRLEKTLFGNFWSDIKGTKIEVVLNTLLEDDLGKSCFLHFINMFEPVRTLSLSLLSGFVGIETERINGIINRGNMLNFPRLYEEITQKISIIEWE